ncbi:hypothetical protein RJ639_033094 [Escallonia herrerae]|uniref:Uncharacterized protein n=1 Tax=Escallonia herrerae TaxID=1293975 RepID=A0AA88WUR1_9ASTE|nr:hypothetical protein RJ639_033094 [Escallonia herrerae]
MEALRRSISPDMLHIGNDPISTLPLLSRASSKFRIAMATSWEQELAHRQQFYFWNNYRNNRLKHTVPRPLPEPAVAPQAPLPPPAPLPPTVNNVTGASAPVPPTSQGLSPMQYGMPPGSILTKNDSRSSGGDRRKRK